MHSSTETSFQSTWSLAGELRPNNVKHVHALLFFFAAMIAPIFSASAQTMDVGMDLGLSSGVLLTTEGTETGIRQATAMAFDISLNFDNEMIEWVGGFLMQMEAPISAAIYPKVRLRRDHGPDAIYAQIGVPWFLVPFRRFGVGLGGGYRRAVGEGLYFFGHGQSEIFFAGADIPDGASVLAFTVVLGGRATF